MNKTQYRILEALADPDILTVQTPATVAYNLDISRTWSNQQLSLLTERGCVERVAKGKYRITDAGREAITER